MIKNIVFDLGGVIVDIDMLSCISEFHKIGYPDAEKMIDPYLQAGIFLKLEAGTATKEELIEYINASVSTPIPPEKIERAIKLIISGFSAYKLDMLLELRKRFSVYMLSNTNPIVYPDLCERVFKSQGLTVDDYFDKIFVSYKMGVVKPHEEIFLQMLDSGGFKASETLFIDDASANVETASKLGFKTYQPKPGEDFRHIFDKI